MSESRQDWEDRTPDRNDTRADTSDVRQDDTDIRQDVSDTRQDTSDIRQDKSDSRQDDSDTRADVSDTRQDVSEVRVDKTELRSKENAKRIEVAEALTRTLIKRVAVALVIISVGVSGAVYGFDKAAEHRAERNSCAISTFLDTASKARKASGTPTDLKAAKSYDNLISKLRPPVSKCSHILMKK